MTRRRLRKGEQTVVEPAVAAALVSVRPHLMAIERVLVEELIPSVPAELRGEVVRRAMNALGNELFVGTELVALAGWGIDTESV